ncbi:uncharacterized protein CCOS01_05731 [Colletotrichum costaricense]|uniref:Uncharacterized protein n=1 Tax=Colletotrichum costaricense TaxID=1209916 RepID=A0AAI9Z202_9PEZI|nr:uncharacterized protein CCOS01_05731 [Colletotrichum costaricense]KAK1530628.1 hypothetical protein CCOS01_05731 [Colletotrichum costaricense]
MRLDNALLLACLASAVCQQQLFHPFQSPRQGHLRALDFGHDVSTMARFSKTLDHSHTLGSHGSLTAQLRLQCENTNSAVCWSSCRSHPVPFCIEANSIQPSQLYYTIIGTKFTTFAECCWMLPCWSRW